MSETSYPHHHDKVLSWAVELDPNALEQALMSARLPFIAGYVALMPDAHYGMGATVGSVIPTIGAIVPSAVGVDIGCGMVAARLNMTGDQIRTNADRILEYVADLIPAGLGKWRAPHDRQDEAIQRLSKAGIGIGGNLVADVGERDLKKIPDQLGTLGSGNHFIEICQDEAGQAWVVLHSGSRGIGNQLARRHIDKAKGVMAQYFVELEDPDLAYFVEGTPDFNNYIKDLMWAQKYALASREWMADLVVEAINDATGDEQTVGYDWIINCHHNYVELEHHHGKNMYITRKGAIRAREDDYGVIPGSMGTGSYVVRGKGNPASFTSAAHGAGRRMSRTAARKNLTVESLREKMFQKTWLEGQANALLDEHPDSYKNLNEVMEAQAELVEPVHELTTILNYKGV